MQKTSKELGKGIQKTRKELGKGARKKVDRTWEEGMNEKQQGTKERKYARKGKN